tara:strand:- start:174 stop:431 length:258 start_codon:yes stop_codon:yes gene_type:complete
MSFSPCVASVAIGASRVDFADHPLAFQVFESSWRLLNNSDELMAKNTRIRIVATNQFEISIANPRPHYADECLVNERHWVGQGGV